MFIYCRALLPAALFLGQASVTKGQLHITYKPRLLNKVIHNLSNIHPLLSALAQGVDNIHEVLIGLSTQGISYQLDSWLSEHAQKDSSPP